MNAAEPDLIAGSGKVFALGHYRFKLTNYLRSEAEEIEKLFPLAGDDVGEDGCETLDLHSQARGGVRPTINAALRHHQHCIWIAAALLRSPQGKLFLLAGPTCAGKSTLTAALAFGHGWTIVAEDVCLIDRQQNAFIPFFSPISMKRGTVELIEAVVGRIPQPLLGEWIPLDTKGLAPALVPAKIDVALELESYLHSQMPPQSLVKKEISVDQMLIKLLKLSNILHQEESIDRFTDYMQSASCLVVSGGQLNERLDFVLELSQRAG